MTTSKDAWNDFGTKLSDLGHKLKDHYQQEHEPDEASAPSDTGEADEASAPSDTGDTGETGEAGGTGDLGERLESLGETIKDAFEALGNAIDDDAVRQDARDAGRLLVDAMDATFTEVGGELRDRFRRK